MSLVDEKMEKCIRQVETTANDIYGGLESVSVNGASFYAAVVYNSTSTNETASVEEAKGNYTIITKRDVQLNFHEVIKRANGQLLRVVTKNEDNRTPASAGLDMRAVNAEEYTG